ncbi:MAG: PEGA domain-containing protein [Candidatus Koribacter versatilis]|uniref:PEGA domain-containing protein n=1 Tax=Candidatus Korobacter versatilis TaxID=658062 RepID=A0A932A755_9BACT|nr:PEGA domain-containing protein [Candidatus Koribacter versatilis]
MRRQAVLALALLLLAPFAFAKDSTAVKAIDWPEASPVLHFTFGKLQEVGKYKGQKSYTMEVTARSMWPKKIDRADFNLYLFDDNQVRVGEGWISISNLGPGEMTKFPLNVSTLGTPVSMKLEAREMSGELARFSAPKTITTTVYSVPPGASLKVDGQSVGSTPIQVKITVGRHDLEFAKEGFHTGHFVWNVTPNDVSGGMVTYELGGLSYDTVELRDGSTITGDVISIDGAQVVVRVGGELRPYERNRVKRILLGEREAADQPTAATPPK